MIELKRVFDRLTVLSYKNGKFECECSCIEKTICNVTYSNLISGNTRSCGCLKKETTIRLNETHGKSKSCEYQCWVNMKARCDKKDNTQYDNYGGRGIRYCKEWCFFENFYADMGPKPSSKHSIDRIDVNKDYSIDNCRWATDTEQANNRRNNKIITFNNKTQTLKQWSDETKIPRTTISNRLNRGWSIEKALTSKPRK